MRRIISFLILICLTLSFAGCSGGEAVEITCDEVEKAYTDAGFYVEHHHELDDYDGSYCHLVIREEEALVEGVDVIYFDFFDSDEAAAAHAEEYEWNIAVYIYAAACGEFRWCRSKSYGGISYSYFGSRMVKPFDALIRSKS